MTTIRNAITLHCNEISENNSLLFKDLSFDSSRCRYPPIHVVNILSSVAIHIDIQRAHVDSSKDLWFLSAMQSRSNNELSSFSKRDRRLLSFFFPPLPFVRLTGVGCNAVVSLFLFQHEPVIQPGSHDYLHHMTLYECRGDQGQLESAAKTSGSVCYQSNQPSLQCNTIAAIWSLGSEVCYVTHLNVN